jgi:hypothetical protein
MGVIGWTRPVLCVIIGVKKVKIKAVGFNSPAAFYISFNK